MTPAGKEHWDAVYQRLAPDDSGTIAPCSTSSHNRRTLGVCAAGEKC